MVWRFFIGHRASWATACSLKAIGYPSEKDPLQVGIAYLCWRLLKYWRVSFVCCLTMCVCMYIYIFILYPCFSSHESAGPQFIAAPPSGALEGEHADELHGTSDSQNDQIQHSTWDSEGCVILVERMNYVWLYMNYIGIIQSCSGVANMATRFNL